MHVEYLLLRVMCVLMHVHVLVGVNVSVIMCILVWIRVHVCVAPPIVVGAWPMAGTLRQLFEYYYFNGILACLACSISSSVFGGANRLACDGSNVDCGWSIWLAGVRGGRIS